MKLTIDIRDNSAKYYDLNPHRPDDISFYKSLLTSPDVSVLELGCGTGRVLLPLSESCTYIHGLDLSEAMIELSNKRLLETKIPSNKALAEVGDITNFDLGRTFDLIIAPYRVLQNLETDEQVDGLFSCIHRHLAIGGSCILNAFKPFRDADGLRAEWVNNTENLAWERVIDGQRITCHDKRARMDATNLILYPELIYRTYSEDELKDETVLKVVMRCYYPDQFKRLIVDHGFEIMNTWGGYAEEIYGEGPELVVQFSNMTDQTQTYR